jgi:hypothetical protein
VVGHGEAGAAVIDAHAIIGAAARGTVKVAVEKDDGDFGGIEGAHDALVGGFAVRAEFERSKEYSADFPANALLASLPGLLGNVPGSVNGGGRP